MRPIHVRRKSKEEQSKGGGPDINESVKINIVMGDVVVMGDVINL